ncbi:MAG: hypothetical protein AAF480_03655 [Actinomycetota bacterium]
MKRLLTIIAVSVLVACGGPTSTVLEPRDTATPPAVVEPTAPPVTAGPVNQPEPAVEPATALSTVLSTTPQRDGWRVAAGRWSTDAFDVPVEFTTSTEMLLVRESRGALWLRTMDGGDDASLILSQSAFVNSGGPDAPQFPPPDDLDGVTAAFENGVFTSWFEAGMASTAERDLPWWDFELQDEAGAAAWLCREGTTCLMTSQTVGGERIIVPTDQRLRLYIGSTDELRIGAWLSGPPEAMDGLEALAEDVLEDIAVVEELGAPGTTRSMTVDGVEATDVPGGRTVALVGDGLVILSAQGELPGVGLDAVRDESLIFATGSGYIALLSTNSLVPPGVDVTTRGNERDWDLAEAAALDSFEQWVEDRVGIVDAGTTDSFVGLIDVPWWDITVLDPANSYSCPVSIGGRCDLLHVSGLGPWGFADGERNRLYHLPETGLMLHIEALTGTVDDVLTEGKALLGALTVEAVAVG